MKYYTGVGSRETPKDILEFIEQVGYWLAQRGYTGRSGSAEGADKAFEKGFYDYLYSQQTQNVSVGFEAYLPWKGFSDIQPDQYHIVTPNLPNYQEAVDIVSQIHPAWNKLGRGARALHTRNVYQVLGTDLQHKSCVLFCYAQPTRNKRGIITGVKGGTNTAVQLAMQHNIPIYNFYLETDIIKVKNMMDKYKGDI